MKTIILKRVSHTNHATFGVLLDAGIPFCVTLELPWRDNETNISCIPEGVYSVAQLDNDEAFDFQHVPGRTGIQIEVANMTSQLLGCIAVGEKYEPLGSDLWAIQESRKAFSELKSRVPGNKFNLKIVPPVRSEYICY